DRQRSGIDRAGTCRFARGVASVSGCADFPVTLAQDFGTYRCRVSEGRSAAFRRCPAVTVTADPTLSACPRCGSFLPPAAPAGLCPRCLLSDGFGSLSEGDFRLRTGQHGPRFVPPAIDDLAGEFPHLEFVQLLGSGGMGAVYLANQIRLDRRV